MKLTSQQKSNLALAMSVLERCRFWSLLTSELALYNACLELTRPHDSFDAPLAFRDRVKVPNSLRHGTSDVIDHGVKGLVGGELVTDGVTSHCSVEGDSATRVDNFDIGSRSEGMLPFFVERDL